MLFFTSRCPWNEKQIFLEKSGGRRILLKNICFKNRPPQNHHIERGKTAKALAADS